MSWNSSNRPSVLKDYDRVVNGLYRARIEFETGMKYKDMYGGYGMVFSRHITPYFWIIPVMASSLLLFTFKRNHLFGPMQRYLITIMIIDVFLTMLTGFKDLVFNILEWNYGFIEYRACWILFSFFRVQNIIHATSLWIKSLMFIHRVLMFLFPFKMRRWNLKKLLVPFIIFHAVMSIFFAAVFMLTPIKRLSTIQEYKPGLHLKRIDACLITEEYAYISEASYRVVYALSFFLQYIYFSALPILIHILCTFFIILLVRKEIKRVSFLTPSSGVKIHKNVKYLVLIKVHILLGISFIFQEVPIYASPIIAATFQMSEVSETAQAIVTVIMFQAFAVGKPVDVIIYASLSKKVKSDLKRIFCCGKTERLKSSISPT